MPSHERISEEDLQLELELFLRRHGAGRQSRRQKCRSHAFLCRFELRRLAESQSAPLMLRVAGLVLLRLQHQSFNAGSVQCHSCMPMLLPPLWHALGGARPESLRRWPSEQLGSLISSCLCGRESTPNTKHVVCSGQRRKCMDGLDMSMRREELDNEGKVYCLWRCQAIERPPEAGFGTNSCGLILA